MSEMDLKLDYVARERMASGRYRYRFQRWGKKVTLGGAPGSVEFMRQYHALLSGVDQPKEPNPRSSIAWLVGLFLSDLEMRVGAGLASPLTLRNHKHNLGRLVEKYGRKDVAMPRKALVRLLDEYTDRPAARDRLKKSVSALYNWGFEKEYVDRLSVRNPALKINTKPRKKTGGFYTCTIDDIRGYLDHHKPGTMARRALMVALCTGARREDARLLGPFNRFTRNNAPWLRWTQSKWPNRIVEIPMMPMLIEEVSGVGDGTFIHAKDGRPLSNGTLGNYVRRWFDEAEVRGTLHGVRKGLSTILTEMGANNYALDVLLGHELGSEETRPYIEAAERAKIADNLPEIMGRISL